MNPYEQDLQTIEELKREAESIADPEERDEALADVAAFLYEIKLAEKVRKDAMDDIEEAKSWDQRHRKPADRTENTVQTSVDFGKIGWINSDETESVPAKRLANNGYVFNFIDLTGYSRATAATCDKLKEQTDASGDNVHEKLLSIITNTTIPVLHENITNGRGKGVRPISIGGRRINEVDAERSLNTSYPAYKEGVHGPQNRAIILRLPDTEGVPSYALAALYDHEDDQQIHNALFLKSK